jgi:AbrB family looped-hinge helix DNA binding protein
MLITAARVSSKGQVVIPASVRKDFGIKTGSTVYFQRAENGKLILETKDPFEDLLALGGSMRGLDLEGELIRMRAEERRREDEKLRNWR